MLKGNVCGREKRKERKIHVKRKCIWKRKEWLKRYTSEPNAIPLGQ